MRKFDNQDYVSVYSIAYDCNKGSSAEYIIKRLDNDVTELLEKLIHGTEPDWSKCITAQVGLVSLAAKIDALKNSI